MTGGRVEVRCQCQRVTGSFEGPPRRLWTAGEGPQPFGAAPRARRPALRCDRVLDCPAGLTAGHRGVFLLPIELQCWTGSSTVPWHSCPRLAPWVALAGRAPDARCGLCPSEQMSAPASPTPLPSRNPPLITAGAMLERERLGAVCLNHDFVQQLT